MNPEDFNYFQSRVTKFITGSTRKGGFGSFLSPKITRLSGIIPKRSLPSQIFSRPTASADDAIESSGRGISSLGRVTLDLEIINNNLDRIRQIIEQDYKNTQETNRKETEDFRKRVANRGRIFGRRELGDKKSDVLGSVKKYVGSFFSGTGGAIRALSMFNLLQGILSGDPSKIIGPLLGIGLTYIPAIATGVAGAIATSLVGKLFGGGAARAAATAATAAPAAPTATKVPRMRKFGKYAALAGLAATGASLLTKPQEDDSQQQRLEELTQEQKGLTDAQNLVPIPQDDLKRFENLNKRFEAALDFLMGKKGGQEQQGAGSGSGGGGGITAPPGGSQSAVPTGNERELLKRLMIAEAGGEGELGMAAVARSVLNRSGLVQSGKTGAGTFGAASGSVSDIISASGQYSPYAQGKLNRALIAAENIRAEKALELAMNEADMRGRLEAMGLQANQINNLISATGFRAGYAFDDSSQNVNVTKLGDHYFNTAGNVGRVSAVGSTSLQTSTLPTTAPRAPRNIPVPQRQAPNVTLVPVDSGNQTPSSVASPSNDSAISVDTTHPENFLALYSKLIYQVV